MTSRDISLDLFTTPGQLISCQHPFARSPGILWDEVYEEKMSTIPVLHELTSGDRGSGYGTRDHRDSQHLDANHGIPQDRDVPFGAALPRLLLRERSVRGGLLRAAQPLCNPRVVRGGSFLEVRKNGADSYRLHVDRERRWARKSRGKFGVFLSSSTEPFLPQEFRYRVTEKLLHAMLESPPDLLILQTHSHWVTEYLEIHHQLHRCCDLRVHISIETDIEEFPGPSVPRQLRRATLLMQPGH